MDKTKKVATAVLSSIIFLSWQMNAVAAEVSTAYSENHVVFRPNPHAVQPFDPTDPDKVSPTSKVDPDDPNNTGTGNAGPLSIDYASTLDFGKQSITDRLTHYDAINAHPFVQVTDNRGTGTGWILSVKASSFKSEDGKERLKGAEIEFENGSLTTNQVNISPKPEVRQDLYVNNDYQTIMFAKQETGRGTWLDVYSGKRGDNSSVQLEVLPGTAEREVQYHTTVSWQLADAPGS